MKKVLFLGSDTKVFALLHEACQSKGIDLEMLEDPAKLSKDRLNEYRLIITKFWQEGSHKTGYQLIRELIEIHTSFLLHHPIRRPKIPTLLIHPQRRMGIEGYCATNGIVLIEDVDAVSQYLM